MKLSNTLLAFYSATAVTAQGPAFKPASEKLTMITESSNPDTDSKGLTSIHTGAGINNFYLADDTSTEYSVIRGNVTQNIPPTPFFVGEMDNVLVATMGGPWGTAMNVKDGYAVVNGSDSVFYACAPGTLSDPYGYSKTQYALGVYAEDETAPKGCEQIKIKISSSTGLSASSSGSSSSAIHSSPASITSSSSASAETAKTTSEAKNHTTVASDAENHTTAPAKTSEPKASPSHSGHVSPIVNRASDLQLNALSALFAVGIYLI